ncbi:MAG: phosphatidate cytidylyltransferase [Prevotella sp.]|nr:phosphatidate cytidylyltransferase [Prevotella sp.]MBQ6186861.1 phosphatidate cytidylyltransferase [Prevotella sp.]
MKNFITRAVSGVIFVAIMVFGLAFNAMAMMFLFSIITGMTVWEYTGLVNERKGVSVNRFITTAAGVYLFLAVAGFCSGVTPPTVFIPYLLTIVYLFISELYLKQEDPINDWAYTMLSQMYIALPFATINMLAFKSSADDGTVYFDRILPLCIFVFLWLNDTGAYCFGSLLGRHKLFPRISPGKSWEGSIGGALLVMVVAAIGGYYLCRNYCGVMSSVPEWIGLAVVVVVFGTWGDLVESLFKRTLGIKDSGNVLPGHGGMLDRFDSSLMAIPAAVIYIYTLTLI